MTEERNVLETVMKISRSMKRQHPHGRRGHDGGHRIMRILKKEGPMNAKDLADCLDIRPASLSEALNRLEQRELIIRVVDEQDKRKVIIRLSEQAEAMISKRRELKDEREQKLQNALTPEEQAEFIRLGNKLIDALTSQEN